MSKLSGILSPDQQWRIAMELDQKSVLATMMLLADRAGRIMKLGRSKPIPTLKPDRTYVTETDRQINSHVIRRIKDCYPGHTVIGEEESLAGTRQYTWVCDPVDGTLPYIMGHDVSVFSIALCEWGVPIVAVVYNPFRDELFFAQKGHGAWLRKGKKDRKLRVNQFPLDKNTFINLEVWKGASLAYDITPLIGEMVESEWGYPRSLSACTYSCMQVAMGQVAACVFPGGQGKAVDVAAADLIVTEAEGRVTSFRGETQLYDRPDIDGCLLSNGVVHEEILNHLAPYLVRGYEGTG